jgi:beta-galactosidase
VTLSVGAVGSGPLSYQWYKDGQPLAGATNATLVLAQAQVSNAGWYAVVVSSPWGSVTNAPAQLMVNPANIGLGLYPGLTIEGMPGYTYEIQYSTDLRQTNGWMTATNLTLEAPVQLWIDTSVNVRAPGAPQRYYRVVGRE